MTGQQPPARSCFAPNALLRLLSSLKLMQLQHAAADAQSRKKVRPFPAHSRQLCPVPLASPHNRINRIPPTLYLTLLYPQELLAVEDSISALNAEGLQVQRCPPPPPPLATRAQYNPVPSPLCFGIARLFCRIYTDCMICSTCAAAL